MPGPRFLFGVSLQTTRYVSPELHKSQKQEDKMTKSQLHTDDSIPGRPTPEIGAIPLRFVVGVELELVLAAFVYYGTHC